MKKILLPVALLFPLAAAAQSMQSGEWELNSTISSPMLPKPQSAKVTQCFSKEDAADPTRLASGPSTQGCTVTPGARTSSSYAWTIACPAQGATGSGNVRYSANTMDAEIRMSIDMQGKKADMVTKVAGRYLGPCKTK